MKTLMLLLLMCGSVSGSFVGRVDSTTGLEWGSAGGSVNDALAAVAPGGYREGFRYATRAEVEELVTHHGEELFPRRTTPDPDFPWGAIGTLDFDNFPLWYSFTSDGIANAVIAGFCRDGDEYSLAEISGSVFRNTEDGTYTNIRVSGPGFSTFPDIDTSKRYDVSFLHFMVREPAVPEPTSLAMWSALGLCFAAWRKW